MSQRFAKPEVGRSVRVVTSYADGVIARHLGHEFNQSKGVVVPSEEWDDPISFRLETGAPHYPVSIIDLNRVVVLEPYDGKGDVKQIEVAPPPINESWMIPGSTGTPYQVKHIDTRWSCSCKGFGFHNKCSHIDKVKLQHGFD